VKAIFAPPPRLCVVIENKGDSVILEPIDGDWDEDIQFSVSLSDPFLILDPTDDEVRDLKPYNTSTT
jgi:hypothetical protein